MLQTAFDWVLAALAEILKNAIFYSAIAIAILCVAVLVYFMKFGGIYTAVWYQQKGRVAKMWRAHSDEKTISAGGLTWSKIREIPRVDKDGKPVKDKDGKPVKETVSAGEPLTLWRRFRPYRVYRCIEGFPTVVTWEMDVPLAPLSADELNMLQRGGFAKGLVAALISKMRRDWVLVLMAFLLGLFVMMALHPLIFHG